MRRCFLHHPGSKHVPAPAQASQEQSLFSQFWLEAAAWARDALARCCETVALQERRTAPRKQRKERQSTPRVTGEILQASIRASAIQMPGLYASTVGVLIGVNVLKLRFCAKIHVIQDTKATVPQRLDRSEEIIDARRARPSPRTGDAAKVTLRPPARERVC
jgi:hypothetical protein